MTQPEQSGGGVTGLVTRRLGPLPVWAWFILFVIAVVVYLRWKAHKTASTANTTQGGVTTDNATPQLQAYQPNYYINVQKPVDQDNPRGNAPPGWVVTPPHILNPNPTPNPITATRVSSSFQPAPPSAAPLTAQSTVSTAPAAPAPAIQPTPVSRVTSITYPVVAGDTLSRIAAQYHTTWEAIYNVPQNKSLITATARSHGYTSNFQDHIYAGENLLIPTT